MGCPCAHYPGCIVNRWDVHSGKGDYLDKGRSGRHGRGRGRGGGGEKTPPELRDWVVTVGTVQYNT